MVDSSLLQEVAWGRVSFPSLDWDALYLLGSPFAYGMLCSFLSWTWGGNHGSVARRENSILHFLYGHSQAGLH